MIECENIRKSFNGQKVVDVDKFSFEYGQSYLLIGSNGSGKSTFARLISGVIRDDKNSLIRILRPDDVSGDKKYLQVGYLAQKAYMFDMSMEMNIRIGYNKANDDMYYKVASKEERISDHIKERMDKIISDFELDYLRGKNAKSFSGGEQQKVALARFMMQDFDILVLDEPTSAMDEKSTLKAEKLIKEYSKGKTLLLITHELEQARRFTEKMFVMNSGKIV